MLSRQLHNSCNKYSTPGGTRFYFGKGKHFSCLCQCVWCCTFADSPFLFLSTTLFEFSECAHTYRELLNPILWFSWARGGDRSSCSSSISPRRHRLLSSFVVRAWMKVVAAVKYISRVSWLAKQIWNAYMRFLV